MKIVITAGGTSERIDNVRKITNSSSGKLGMTIANELLDVFGNEAIIYYVCSKNSLRPDPRRVRVIEVDGAFDLKEKVETILKEEKIDYFIHSMAVSDYTTDYVTTLNDIRDTLAEKWNMSDNFDKAMSGVRKLNGTKISSYEDNLVIVLKQTPKIISLIKDISPSTFLVGFKLLDGVSKEELIDVAKKLRDKNHCDLVVANDLANIRKGRHKAYIIDKNDNIEEACDKDDIAFKIVKNIN